MNSEQPTVRWKRVTISIGIGITVAIAIATVIDAWKKPDLWCVRLEPNGSEKTLYGKDCDFHK